MHVCVLGAGITGLASAYLLREAGHEVTVLDRDTVAAGASAANGGQLSYAYVQPLAQPTIWRQLPGLLLSASSPLKIRPRLDIGQWRWGAGFLRACTDARAAAATAALLELAAESRAVFDQVRVAERMDAGFRENGKLVIFRAERDFDAACAQMALQQQLRGPAQHALAPAQVAALEPALAQAAPQLAGAIHTPSECVADCAAVCANLADLLAQRGVEFLLRTGVTGFRMDRGRVAAARTAQGEIAADAFVLCAGTGSIKLARSLGVRLPVYPLKGYSLTLDVVGAASAPRVSVTDADRKVVFAPIGRRLRVAGMAELVGDDLAIPAQRVASLSQATQSLFPDACNFTQPRAWAGLRPATPHGLPIVGRLEGAPRNLLFNTGHGALGFTLAFGTAARLVRVLEAQRAAAGAPRSPAARLS